MLQPAWALALLADFCVRLLAKGVAITFVAFRAFHPAKPSAWPCGTGSGLPKRYAKMRLIIFGYDTCP